MSDTGVPEPVVVFDCDGTLNNKATGQIGVDNGAEWDLTPMLTAIRLGCRVAVMTCNEPEYVARKLRELGIRDVFADMDRRHKVPPVVGQVHVTDRKVLADMYLDDRNGTVPFRYGDDVRPLLAELFARLGWAVDEVAVTGYRAHGTVTAEYQAYVAAVKAASAGNGDEMTISEALCNAQRAAAEA